MAAQRVNAFKEKNIPLSQKVYSLPGADFSDISNKYDTIIVGSDQVWRPKYTGGIEKYFLSFADNRIKNKHIRLHLVQIRMNILFMKSGFVVN